MRLNCLVLCTIVPAFALAGCASNSNMPGAVPTLQPASALARGAKPDRPLDYRLTVENKLSDTLNVTVTAGKNATLSGESSFELKPGERETVRLAIRKYEPGTIATLNAQNAPSQQQMLNTISLAASNQGVMQIYSIDVLTGLNEATSSTLDANLASFTAIAKPD